MRTAVSKMMVGQDALNALGKPTDQLVRLKSGRLAIFVEQTEKSMLTPIVKVFFSIKSSEPIKPEMLDLKCSQGSIVCAEDPTRWGFDLKQITGI